MKWVQILTLTQSYVSWSKAFNLSEPAFSPISGSVPSLLPDLSLLSPAHSPTSFSLLSSLSHHLTQLTPAHHLEVSINFFFLYWRRIYHFYTFIIYCFWIIICFVVTSLFRGNNVPSGDLVRPFQRANHLDRKPSRHMAWIIFSAFKTEQSILE